MSKHFIIKLKKVEAMVAFAFDLRYVVGRSIVNKFFKEELESNFGHFKITF